MKENRNEINTKIYLLLAAQINALEASKQNIKKKKMKKN